MGSVITSDASRTHARYIALRRYLHAHVLTSSKQFLCPHARACRASHPDTFLPGQLHYLGRHYDLAVDGEPMRVVVVGQEYGHKPARCTMAQRRRRIAKVSAREKRFFADEKHEGRNPHMRGTTSALRVLHGREPGDDYEGEWLDLANEKPVRAHLFDTFALVNYLLCSALEGDSKQGRSTKTMKTNCAPHFRKALDILSPTIVVVQGEGFAKWVVKELPSFKASPRSDTFGRARFPEGEARVVLLSHPSAPGAKGWGSLKHSYLYATVVPALARVRPS